QLLEHIVGPEKDVGESEDDRVLTYEGIGSIQGIWGTDRLGNHDVGEVEADDTAVNEIRRDVPLPLAQDHIRPAGARPGELGEQIVAGHPRTDLALRVSTESDRED